MGTDDILKLLNNMEPNRSAVAFDCTAERVEEVWYTKFPYMTHENFRMIASNNGGGTCVVRVVQHNIGKNSEADVTALAILGWVLLILLCIGFS